MIKKPLLALLPTLSLMIAAAQPVYMTTGGIVNFTSDAPLEVIKASSDKLQGAISINERSFAFTIDNSSFKGFNSPLQQ
jgi:hypothetical protein